MNTILVPLDGSELARTALPYAQMLASTFSAHIHLLRVLSSTDQEDLFISPSSALYKRTSALGVNKERTHRIWTMLRQQAEADLQTQAALLREAGFEVLVDIRVGSPAETIVKITEHESVNMIVMATHGYSGLRRWALGSVTDKVVRATTTPVFVIRGNTIDTAVVPKIKRIMVPVDGSSLSRQALPCALEMAVHAGAELLLLRAVPPVSVEYYNMGGMNGQPMPVTMEHNRAEYYEQVIHEMRALSDELKQHNVPITTHVTTGYPAEVIVDEAERHHVDVIVMATHGYGGLQRWALGSVADKVLHVTSTPLVMVHAHNFDS